MKEYSIYYKSEHIMIENHEIELSDILEKIGVEIITGNKKYAFSVRYDGTLDQFREKIKAEGFDLEKISLGPRCFVDFPGPDDPFIPPRFPPF